MLLQIAGRLVAEGGCNQVWVFGSGRDDSQQIDQRGELNGSEPFD